MNIEEKLVALGLDLTVEQDTRRECLAW